MMRFLGKFEARIDVKSRVFVPAAFRRVLEAEAVQMMYLRKDLFQDCLIVYPQSVWEKELTILRSRLNKWVPEEQELYRQFMLDAEGLEMDASGRILISRSLLNRAGIESDVCFLGMDDTFEIWPASVLQKPRIPSEIYRKQISDIMKPTIVVQPNE
jgi:MraZ protein